MLSFGKFVLPSDRRLKNLSPSPRFFIYDGSSHLSPWLSTIFPEGHLDLVDKYLDCFLSYVSLVVNDGQRQPVV